MRREFYFQDDKSNKFWHIERDGLRCTTYNGRVGATPRSTTKDFDSEDKAQKFFDAQIASKQKSGYVEGQAPAYTAPDWASLSMSEAVFWRLIGLLNWKKLGDDDAVVAPLVKALAQMSVADIEAFETLMAEKLHALDTQAHGLASLENEGDYFSSDLFLYTRACVVANGAAFYAEVLADPAKTPKDAEFEALLYVAGTAFEAKTGEAFGFVPRLSYETGANRAGWPED